MTEKWNFNVIWPWEKIYNAKPNIGKCESLEIYEKKLTLYFHVSYLDKKDFLLDVFYKKIFSVLKELLIWLSINIFLLCSPTFFFFYIQKKLFHAWKNVSFKRIQVSVILWKDWIQNGDFFNTKPDKCI